MYPRSLPRKHHPEEFLAELTDAAYRVVLGHGIKGSFLNVELDLWNALREVLSSRELKTAEEVSQRRLRAEEFAYSAGRA